MSLEILHQRPSGVAIPIGLVGHEAFVAYMHAVTGVEREWLVVDGSFALPVWRKEGQSFMGGKTYLLLDPAVNLVYGNIHVPKIPWGDIVAFVGQLQVTVATTIPPHIPRMTRPTELYLLSLREGAEAIWKNLDKKWRNQVRKGERERWVFRDISRDEFDTWYALQTEHAVRLGNKPYTPERMNAFIDSMGTTLLWKGLWKDGVLMVSGLGHADGAYATLWWQASDPRAWDMCANNVFYWKLIEELCRRDSTLLDLGPSSRFTAHPEFFKIGMGAERVPIFRTAGSFGGWMRHHLQSAVFQMRGETSRVIGRK